MELGNEELPGHIVQREITELRDRIRGFLFDDSKYGLRYFSIEELKQITDDFSENNFIGEFQFGKFYRGFQNEQVFTVKKWEDPENTTFYYHGENEIRQINEIKFLKQSKVCSHPNLVKLKGYSRINEDQLFMVYDLKALNSVHNLIQEDSFTWLQRIKVFLGFAHLLHVLHNVDYSNPSYLLRNIDAAHILVDEDYNPILCDFSLITGGIFPHWREYPNEYLNGPFGYRPLTLKDSDWSEKHDVFAIGTLLLMLISKRVYSEDYARRVRVRTVPQWGLDSYELRKSAVGLDKVSLVHESLRDSHGYHSGDGVQITKLAASCVSCRDCERPTMKQIIKKLLKLVVLRDHSDFLGTDQLQCFQNYT